MKSWKLALTIAASLSAVAGTAHATPLTLQYCVQDQGGGVFRYQFTLTLDNNDNTWTAGQGFGWIIFGDIANNQPSPLTNFAADPASLPAGPFTQVQGSGGGHNGPTLGPVVQGPPNYPPNLWIPAAVGDSITWAGTSTADLPAGQLLWSNLMAGSGGVYANFESASRLSSCGGGSGCYANCDGSTGVGFLNINDFVCFQSAFAGGASYANCDGSTGANNLNINDFVCFQSAFAAGCSAP